MKRVLVIASIALLAPAAQSQSLSERAAKDEIVLMQDEDPHMQKAFTKARATLDGFLALARKPPADTAHFSVKVGIREGKNTEYFWLGPFREEAGGFSGTIDNTPRMVKRVKEGQTWRFSKSEIVDWTYVDRAQKRMHGNFTMCALLTKEPPAEAEAARKRYGLRCD